MLRSCQLSQCGTHRSAREHFHMCHNSKLDAVLKYLFKSPFRPLWAPQASQGVYPSPERGPRGQLRWRWWLFPATVSGLPWFNRHFLVQWTAWWVVKTPMLPAVASPCSIAGCWCTVMAVVSTTRSDAHTNLPTSTPTHLSLSMRIWAKHQWLSSRTKRNAAALPKHIISDSFGLPRSWLPTWVPLQFYYSCFCQHHRWTIRV